jgi:hypothetical protein
MANTEYFFTFWPRGSFRRVVYHYRNRATILALFATAHGVSPPREWMALHRLKQLAASSPGNIAVPSVGIAARPLRSRQQAVLDTSRTRDAA